MEVLNKIFRIVRISIFVIHTLWIIKTIVYLIQFELDKTTLFTYIFLTGFFFASFVLFSTLYEKTIPIGKKNDKVLGRFVYMFKAMATTTIALVLVIIVNRIFLS